MGTGLTVTSWCCASLAVLCFSVSGAATSLPSARHFGSGALEAEGGGMLSVSEGRQINTTKHFGGGVNVSAGATLLIKGWCSLSPIHTHRTYSETALTTSKQIELTLYHAHCYVQHKTNWHPKSSPSSRIHKQNRQLEEQRLLLLNAACAIQPPQV